MGPRKISKQILDSASGKLSDAVRSSTTAKAVSGVEDRLTANRLEKRLEDGTLRGVKIVVHRGWVADGVARILVRVVEAPDLPGASKIPYWDVLNENLKRHAVLAFPGVPVSVELGDAIAENETDRHGFAALLLPVPDLTPGWHEVTATVRSEEDPGTEYGSTGRILAPNPAAEFLVVSDIDDTVIRTGLDEGLTAFRRTVLGEAETRRSVPGMASLYRGLSRGPDGEQADQARPAFFYLSTGSWSFYEMLVQFLQLRGYPRGPLFLTDWGPTDRYVRRSGRQHKDQTLARLEEAYPDQQLILIGDSGQADPDIYTEFARANPGRTKLIMIIRAGDGSAENAAKWREAAPTLQEEGIPLHVIDDALQGVKVCQALGLCDDLAVEEVEVEIGAIF